MIRAWLSGRSVARQLAKALERGTLVQVSIHDNTPAGYYAALYLQRQGYPFNCTANSIEFSRKTTP